jgi:glycine betaine catabolism B
LIVRKIKRGQMVLTFIAVAVVATAVFTFMAGGDIAATLIKTLLHSSLLFLAFVMLTEPLTSPPMTRSQRWYAALVGVLIPPQVHLGGLYATPELALVAGNILSFIISPKVQLLPRLAQIVPWGATTKDFVFDVGKFKYQPGQYMEFTLPHSRTDSRGSRRFFTLASSPTEDHLRIGVKIIQNGSSFKKAMLTLNDQSQIAAGALGGDFVLPKDQSRKLAFIAGGIGVTPFRSMIKYVLDTGQKRDITMIYSERRAREMAYADVFNAAQKAPGMRIIYTVMDKAESVPVGFRKGLVTAEMIEREVPDYAERIFYISGPHPMVVAVQEALADLGVPKSQTKVDFFPGYA